MKYIYLFYMLLLILINYKILFGRVKKQATCMLQRMTTCLWTCAPNRGDRSEYGHRPAYVSRSSGRMMTSPTWHTAVACSSITSRAGGGVVAAAGMQTHTQPPGLPPLPQPPPPKEPSRYGPSCSPVSITFVHSSYGLKAYIGKILWHNPLVSPSRALDRFRRNFTFATYTKRYKSNSTSTIARVDPLEHLPQLPQECTTGGSEEKLNAEKRE